ncbi:hypothetical protein SAMN05216516_10779 [Izhakiella capsodis]|uniref:Uncharacterized protein n=1 Tax=Izhakiella capsodis TaxID=1367852 RepID=A0A1I4YXX2_9GAMM|nr:hypothetical protein [Izhakiella capsodis]SFN42490.1 hypothetical protein SAMN05216516_10779 [Izhakiella capsodis]
MVADKAQDLFWRYGDEATSLPSLKHSCSTLSLRINRAVMEQYIDRFGRQRQYPGGLEK